MLEQKKWIRSVSGLLAVAGIWLCAPATYAGDVAPTSLLREETPPQDAQLAFDPDETVGAEPVHPWDNNDYSDTLDLPGNLRHKPKHIPTVPQRVSDKVQEQKATPGTLPERIGFVRNLPNPFNAQTRIEFALLQTGPAALEVYNLLGQLQSRVEWAQLAAGTHSWLWRGQTADGRPAPSGVYFYRLETSQASAIGRMVLLK